MRIRWNRVFACLGVLGLIVFALTHWADIVECLERLRDALTSPSPTSWRRY